MRYKIWNKQDAVITPSGEVFTAEEWLDRYPAGKLEQIKVVCAAGEINGAFYGTLGQMIDLYSQMGCDFSGCVEDQDYLDAIEAFEDMRNEPSDESSPEDRIAAALEYQNLLASPIVNPDDPDEE